MEYLTARIPLLASDLLARFLSSGGTGNISHDDVMLWLHEYGQITKTQPVELAFVRPDYESIKQQLQSRLIERDSWKDLIQAGVGETLLEFIASIGAFSQLSIQRGLQESMLDTARLTSSVYNITRMLGVHISRKTPARVEVMLRGDGTYIQIPKYSQFEINGMPFFNRDSIVMTDRTPNFSVTLYQGQVQVETLTSTGRPFQRFEIGDSDFNISDTDVLVINDTFTEYKRIIDGLWHYEGAQYVFFENTTPTGNVELMFGNSLYGRMPPLDEKLFFIYCLTLGDESHSTRTELTVKVTELNDSVPDRLRGVNADVERARVVNVVTGTTNTPISGGDAEKDKEFYRALAPQIFASRGRAVTRADYRAVAMQYPGIVDVYLQGQQEMAPNNRNYINTIGITPLLKNGTPMNEGAFAEFTTYIAQHGVWQHQYIHIPAREVLVDVRARVLCAPGTDLPKVKTYIEYRLAEGFGIRRGALGYSMYLNDLHALLRAQHHALKVDYVELTEPSTDYVIDKTEYVKLNSLRLDIDYSTRGFSTYVPNAR